MLDSIRSVQLLPLEINVELYPYHSAPIRFDFHPSIMIDPTHTLATNWGNRIADRLLL